MRTVYDLMCVVARHLTGKAVRVRMTKPVGGHGMTWCDELGRLTVDISPDLSHSQTLYVFLHELGHCLHHNFIPVTEEVMSRTPENKTSVGYSLREDHADIQAKTWLEYGQRYRDHTLPEVEGVLTALLTYYE